MARRLPQVPRGCGELRRNEEGDRSERAKVGGQEAAGDEEERDSHWENSNKANYWVFSCPVFHRRLYNGYSFQVLFDWTRGARRMRVSSSAAAPQVLNQTGPTV